MRLLAAGDVHLGSHAEDAFSAVRDHIQSADMAYCDLEGPVSDRGTPVTKPVTLRSHPRAVEALKASGMSVVSVANNHCMDYGIDAFMDTLRLLDEQGIKHAGGGTNLAEARKPAVVEAGGTRVAFLGYASLYDLGAGATETKPGLAPVQVDPLYEPPHLKLEDVELLRQDIRQAKEVADMVAVAFHWGVSVGRTLTVYQRALARETIDAGAEMVLGGHPHVLQGIEVHRGKPVFYNLGNFISEAYPPFFTLETKESMMVFLDLSREKVESVELVPTYADRAWDPVPVDPDSERWDSIATRLEEMSGPLGTRLERRPGRLFVRL